MALCTQACCNAEARRAEQAEQARIFAERKAAFELYLEEREARKSGIVAAIPTAENEVSPEVWTRTPEGIPTLDMDATRVREMELRRG